MVIVWRVGELKCVKKLAWSGDVAHKFFCLNFHAAEGKQIL